MQPPTVGSFINDNQFAIMNKIPRALDTPSSSTAEDVQRIASSQLPEDNPFDSPRYRNMNVPDIPISYGNGIVDAILNDSEVPEEVRKAYWFVFHKDNVLTFLDKQRKDSKLLNFDITKIDILNATPYYEYDFKQEIMFGVLRNAFETKLDRAMGIQGGNLKNERIILQSQFQENRMISEQGNSSGFMKEGFFKRLLGRRG